MTQSEIETNNASFCAALANHDMDRLMGFYDPEVVLLVPGAPSLRGHDAVREYYQNVFAAGVTAAEMRTLQVEEVGDELAEVGEYTMILEPPEAERLEDVGKYMVVHRRQPGGGWAIWLDMVHSDGSVPSTNKG
jgi:uncharacterized protein (TIGR02246 family)